MSENFHRNPFGRRAFAAALLAAAMAAPIRALGNKIIIDDPLNRIELAGSRQRIQRRAFRRSTRSGAHGPVTHRAKHRRKKQPRRWRRARVAKLHARKHGRSGR
ncbi:MAG: hypothetical protein KGL39_09555 [Patescibacteria group bacterium]|nr:hypothetical protein [Patescibacteria group bacterium]